MEYLFGKPPFMVCKHVGDDRGDVGIVRYLSRTIHNYYWMVAICYEICGTNS